jgi:hypothetical protein
MAVDRASPKAVLRPIVPLRRSRTNEGGPSPDDLHLARKDAVGTRMQRLAS